MKILALDTRTDIILLQEAISESNLPIELQAVHKFKDVLVCLIQEYYTPDVIIIGSDVLLREGIEKLFDIKTDEKFRMIPLVVLTEFTGEEKHLFEENFYNTHFLARPLDYNEMHLLLERIIEIGRLTVSKEL